MNKYDIIVVGAGNAGLAAATKLALEKKKVLLLEQHNLPGGCATSYRRGRFEIDPSLHELCSVGTEEEPGDVRKLFAELGVDVNWCRVKDCFRVVSTYSDGTKMDVTMPSGIGNFIDKMEQYVPGSRQAMENLFSLFDEVFDAVGYFNAGGSDVGYMMKKYPNFLRIGSYSAKIVFKALKLPARCQEILSTYWTYLGVDMERLSFFHYTAMVYTYIKHGAYIPGHTSHELSVALAERFLELGGEIRYNCRAKQFLFDGDRCYGVETTEGVMLCDYALANINPDIVYGRMIPKQLVPARERKLAAARKGKFGGRMFTVCFCLDVPYQELGIHDYSIFMPGTTNSAVEYKNILLGMKTNEYALFLCYNVENPNASPEGTCICSITTFASPRDWNDLPQRDYVRFKNEAAMKLQRELKERTGIDFTGHIEEVSVATPWTFARYLGTPEGAVYGHETADWDGIMARSMMVENDYPINGLRTIGAAGPHGCGYGMAYDCGMMMANKVLEELAARKGGAE